MPIAGESPARQTAATFAMDENRLPLASLEGLWRFHPGDNLSWADPGLDDSQWPLLASDKPWSDQGYPGMSGLAWYRFLVVVPTSEKPMALQFGPILTSYQVFIEGSLVGGIGNMDSFFTPASHFAFHDVLIPPPTESEKRHGSRTIHVAIRVWHTSIWASYVGGGPQFGSHKVGDAQILGAELDHQSARRRLLFVDMYSYTIAAAIISLTTFGLFLFRPRETEYLWFAILLLAKAADLALAISEQVYAFPSIPIFDLCDSVLIASAQVALLLFLSRVLGLRRGIVWKVVLGLAVLSAPMTVLYWPGWLPVPMSALLSVLLILPSSVWMLVTLGLGAIRRDITARLLLVPVLLVQGLYVADNVTLAMLQFGVNVDPRLFESPLITVPYSVHPAVLAELTFLLAMLAFLIRRFSTARRREERLEGALEAARQVQQILLPEAIPQVEGFAVECVYRPAESVGGDFFQLLPAADGGLLLVVGDVAGKGLPAAMMVSMIIGVIRTGAAQTSDPALLLGILNDRLIGRSLESFTTCLCAHFSADGELTLVSGGHLPPYLNGKEILMDGSLPLGFAAWNLYPVTSLPLAVGDRLAFVSDGVVEAQSKSGELLGFDRTEELSTLSAAGIAAAASEFGQVDDITVVTICYTGSEKLVAIT